MTKEEVYQMVGKDSYWRGTSMRLSQENAELKKAVAFKKKEIWLYIAVSLSGWVAFLGCLLWDH